MEKIDIKVRKGKNGSFIDGPFYVREVPPSEIVEFLDKVQKAEDSRLVTIQNCLVFKDGSKVFKPQQINLIEDRMSGVDFMMIVFVANQINRFNRLGEVAEIYKGNSEGDQDSE